MNTQFEILANYHHKLEELHNLYISAETVTPCMVDMIMKEIETVNKQIKQYLDMYLELEKSRKAFEKMEHGTMYSLSPSKSSFLVESSSTDIFSL